VRRPDEESGGLRGVVGGLQRGTRAEDPPARAGSEARVPVPIVPAVGRAVAVGAPTAAQASADVFSEAGFGGTFERLAKLDYRILGPLEVWDGDRRLPLGAAKQRAVLALLLINANRVVSVDRMIEELWPEKPPGRPQTAIQTYVSYLRKILEPDHAAGAPFDVLATEGAGYVLRLEPEQLDLGRFEKLYDHGRGALAGDDPARARAALAEALALFRGSALMDVAYEPFAQAEVARIEELRLSCLEARVEADLASGSHAELVGELEALAAEHPLRERFAAQLMLALYRAGRQAEALDVYQRTRERLVDELGIEPTPELHELNRRILNQDDALVAPVRAKRPVVQLPAPPTPLIGRHRELAELAAWLGHDDVRLITLLGPGGVGKTRLALAAASRAVDRFTDGVFWIPLQGIRDPGLVVSTIAQGVGADRELAETIGEGRVLLALDNFEQVIDAAVEVADLVAACPSLTVLVTSREPLHLAAEHEYPVQALPEVDAVSLFTERASAVRRDLRPNGEVVAICRRLERLPLALELAAARVNVLSLQGILERLDDRLAVLTRGARDLPDRHQTLRQTIEWSYDLLDEEEQRAFERLGVFAGGWTLEAAEAVCRVDLDALASLIDKSLLRRSDPPDSEPRYTMLETIREYALERLVETEPDRATQNAHFRWFLEVAGHAESALRGPEEQLWLDLLERDHDNLRGALSFALDHCDGEAALQLAARLSRFWLVRGFLTEATSWLEQALAVGEPGSAKATGLRWLAIFAMEQGEIDRPAALAEEALAMHRSSADELGVARSLDIVGDTKMRGGDLVGAAEFFEEGIETARRLDARPELGTMLYDLGVVCLFQAELDRAGMLLEEARTVFRELGFARGEGSALQGLAFVAVERDQPRRALSLLGGALSLYIGLAWVGGLLNCLDQVAQLFVVIGEPAPAATIWGAHAARCDEIGREYAHPLEAAARDEAIAGARSTLGEEAFARGWEQGAQLSLEEAAALALSAIPERAPA
jgi:predicted ATPase/DNA-binding SARP family transcriptional activator